MSLAVPPQNQAPSPYPLWVTPIVIALLAAILLWLLSEVLLVIFASIVIAVGLTGLAKPLAVYARLPPILALLIATVVVVVVIGWPFSHFGARLWAQFDEIARDIPTAVASIKQTLEAHSSVQFLEDVFGGFDFRKMAAPVAAHLTNVVSSVGTVLSYAIILLFGGLYLAMDPERYIKGAIYLTPPQYRDRVQHFLARSGANLRMWLFTQLLVVLINGVFAGIGLWAFGVHGAAALAMLGGLLSFVPYVGTIVAMVIGSLAALPQGADFAIYALIVFGAASFFEGYLITPYIQSKTLSLPPVILIFAIFAFTILFGMLGVILAAPLTVVSMVALDTFYKPAKA
ncbi:MAG: AI-2E family transporter [Beijerinckiaceae bacterium]|nr:AI-2E family transporter [Beijerinckiaceae bacterium]